MTPVASLLDFARDKALCSTATMRFLIAFIFRILCIDLAERSNFGIESFVSSLSFDLRNFELSEGIHQLAQIARFI